LIEFLVEYGMFLAKIVTFVVAIIVVIGFVVSIGQKNIEHRSGHLEIKKINDKFRHMEEALLSVVLDSHAFKARQKKEKQAEKEKARQQKKSAISDSADENE